MADGARDPNGTKDYFSLQAIFCLVMRIPDSVAFTRGTSKTGVEGLDSSFVSLFLAMFQLFPTSCITKTQLAM